MKTTPKLSGYRNAAFIAFFKDVITICNKFNPQTLKIDKEIALVNAKLSMLDEVFATAKANANTETLESLDARRDNAINGISTLTDAYKKHFDTSMQEAARTLGNIISQYGKRISALTYLDETEAIRSLVNTFETDNAAKAAIDTLNINDWVHELKITNNDFNTVYLIRNTELSAQPDQSIRDLKQPTIDNYRTLINVITAYDTLNPHTDYSKILQQIEELSIKYNALVPLPPKPDNDTPPPQA